jgi:hypothetical protein
MAKGKKIDNIEQPEEDRPKGRPRIQLNLATMYEMGYRQMPVEKMADIFGVDKGTIYNKFKKDSNLFDAPLFNAYNEGKAMAAFDAIRKVQDSENPMLIKFAAQNVSGWSERTFVESNAPVVTIVNYKGAKNG